MNESAPLGNTNPTRTRAWLWRIAKWALCLGVLAFVGLRAWELWSRDEVQSVSVSVGWLAASFLAYLIGWLPSVWYWRRLMQAMGHDVPPGIAARAFFCGHLGKYVPGKAGVLIIRAGMLKAAGSSAAVGAITATAETLLFMGTGLAIGLALFPVINWPPVVADWFDHSAIMPVIVLVLLLCVLPAIAFLLRRFATWITPAELAGDTSAESIDARLIGLGIAVFCVSWALHGLSVGFAIRSVAPHSAGFSHWPVWMGAAGLAASIGFLAIFAPGGIGVREGLLIEILRAQPEITERQAIVVAVLLRLTWVVAEIVAAVALYYAVRQTRAETK